MTSAPKEAARHAPMIPAAPAPTTITLRATAPNYTGIFMLQAKFSFYLVNVNPFPQNCWSHQEAKWVRMGEERSSFMKSKWISVLGIVVLAAAVPAQVSTFSTGEGTPETISRVPDRFGAFDGQLFVPDFLASVIWRVPRRGGSPVVFVTEGGSADRGGLFLPGGWGNLRGQFLVSGDQPIANNAILESVRAYDNAGNVTKLISNYAGLLGGPILADNDFMQLRNNVLIGDATNGKILAIAPGGTVSTVATGLDGPWGLANSPRGFGTYDDALFYSSSLDGTIGVVDRNGVGSVFATITPAQGLQTNGLRQIAFAPRNWLSPIGVRGRVLLVSIPDSNGISQTGVHGSILALDSRGNLVATFKRGPNDKFDPRGMFFLGDQDRDDALLVSDASHAILKIRPWAFTPSQSNNNNNNDNP